MVNWYVIYTKPRNEKKVALQLEKIGITVYCPLITEMHQWSNRKKKVEVPLISSYLFVQLKEKERSIVFQVPGVVRYLFWLGNPAIVPEQEIDLLKEWLSGEVAEVSVKGLVQGDQMSITSGPFSGKDGIVEHVSNNSIQVILKEIGLKVTLRRNGNEAYKPT